MAAGSASFSERRNGGATCPRSMPADSAYRSARVRSGIVNARDSNLSRRAMGRWELDADERAGMRRSPLAGDRRRAGVPETRANDRCRACRRAGEAIAAALMHSGGASAVVWRPNGMSIGTARPGMHGHARAARLIRSAGGGRSVCECPAAEEGQRKHGHDKEAAQRFHF